MKSEKRSRIGKSLALLLIFALVTTSALSGTLAKYTKTMSDSVSDTARVAAFKVGYGSIADQDVTEIDLFNTALDSSDDTDDGQFPGADADVVLNSTDYSFSGTDKLIAPGTWGYAPVGVYNASEVNVYATLAFVETNASSVPVKYALIDAVELAALLASTDSTADLDDLATAALSAISVANLTDTTLLDATGTGLAIAAGADAEVYLVWYWDFDGDDTALGEAAALAEVTVQVAMTATFVQID